ncbi:RNA polymerase sigma factor [Planctomycetales bacterium]|nr:RNA polymerase sigma factor [Planctomycetales bacterium]
MSAEPCAQPDYFVQDPDVRLMLAVQQDDAASFEELMLRYQSRIQTLLRHVLGDRDQAEDLTQEVFLRIYRGRKTYKPQAKFSTWVFTIANNIALNALRSKRRKPEVQFGMENSNSNGSGSFSFSGDMILASSGFIPARRIEKIEIKEMVQLALESLGERQRAALLLHKFEDMSYNDIADIMEMTPQAVKSLLCRARICLRDALQGYMQRGSRPH